MMNDLPEGPEQSVPPADHNKSQMFSYFSVLALLSERRADAAKAVQDLIHSGDDLVLFHGLILVAECQIVSDGLESGHDTRAFIDACSTSAVTIPLL